MVKFLSVLVSNCLSFAFCSKKIRKDFLLCQKFSVLANHRNLKWLARFRNIETDNQVLAILNQSFLGRTTTSLEFDQKRYVKLWIYIMETYLGFCDIKSKKAVPIEAFRKAQSEWRIIVKLMEYPNFNEVSANAIRDFVNYPDLLFPPKKVQVKPLSFDLSKPYNGE